jgi:hypothetical protein
VVAAVLEPTLAASVLVAEEALAVTEQASAAQHQVAVPLPKAHFPYRLEHTRLPSAQADLVALQPQMEQTVQTAFLIQSLLLVVVAAVKTL